MPLNRTAVSVNPNEMSAAPHGILFPSSFLIYAFISCWIRVVLPQIEGCGEFTGSVCVCVCVCEGVILHWLWLIMFSPDCCCLSFVSHWFLLYCNPFFCYFYSIIHTDNLVFILYFDLVFIHYLFILKTAEFECSAVFQMHSNISNLSKEWRDF